MSHSDSDSNISISELQIDPATGALHKNPYRFCAPNRFRLRLNLAYDGGDFHGWQRQTHAGETTHTTAQGTIEAAVEKIFGEKMSVVGASRTDAGVHAQMQVAHFDSLKDPSVFRDLRYALQSVTPPSLVIKEVFLAPREFHSIATSIDKTYRYSILNRRVPSALRHRTTWWVRDPLDLDFLNEATQHIIGTHDFKSFQTSGTFVESTVRTVLSAKWSRPRPADGQDTERDTLVFEVQGQGFLKQMVRNIVGTLVDLQHFKRPAGDMKTILEARDRRKAGNTADPQGLFLAQIRYPPELDNRCRPL